MQCPKCGAFYSEEDEFCGECGLRLRPETLRGPSSGPPRMEDGATAAHKPAKYPPEPAAVAPPPQRSSSRLPLRLGVVLVLLLCLGFIAAVSVFTIVEKPGRNPTDAVPALGEALYQEDFRDPDSGWEAWDEGGTSGKYVDGEYRLAVRLENYMAWSHPVDGRDFRDVAVEVDARQVEGSLDSTFGLIVRYQVDEERYYWFQISGDGYYSVEKKREGEWILLQPWEASDAIKQGLDARNRLRVVCYGDRLSFYVNDTLLADLTDDALRAGTVGLAAGAYAEPPVAVLFDNLSVYALED